MTDQNRIDTLAANAYSAMYRENGKVDFNAACEQIHDADGFTGLVGLVLEYLQQPERRRELADTMAEVAADGIRQAYRDEVQSILEAEKEADAIWKTWHMSHEDYDRLNDELDDPRREEKRGAA